MGQWNLCGTRSQRRPIPGVALLRSLTESTLLLNTTIRQSTDITMDITMISRRLRSTPGAIRALVAVVACTVALSLVAAPSGAMRHLRLVRSSPSADSVYATSPDAIRLWLSEPAEAPGSKIALTTSNGAVVALQALTRDTARTAPLIAKLVKPLSNGAYTVTWKAMSKDGHIVKGTINFKVGAAK